jgi:phosphatidylglycerol:prolipoprotein diacylglycerol transferase
MLLYDLPSLVHEPLSSFAVWRGGMASHGGFIGLAGAALWAARRLKVPAFHVGDLITLVAPQGLFLGRVANFINGELWGRPSDAPWAVIFPLSAPGGTSVEWIAPRHPSQLYEAGLEGLLLLAWTQWRLWKTDAWKTPGRITGEFLVLYAVVRIAGEQFREPDAGLLLGLSRGVFYSLFVLLAGLLVLATRKRA